MFILLRRERDQCAITSLRRSCQLSVHHFNIGNPAKCLSQQHYKYTCWLFLHTVPLLLSVKQGSCEYQFSSHWFDPTRNQTESTAPEADVLPLSHLSCCGALLDSSRIGKTNAGIEIGKICRFSPVAPFISRFGYRRQIMH